jgi:hypothetical protein
MRINGENSLTVESMSRESNSGTVTELAFSGFPLEDAATVIRAYDQLGRPKVEVANNSADPLTPEQVTLYNQLYRDIFSNFRMATWNLREFSHEAKDSSEKVKVLRKLKLHVLAVQELMSEEAAIAFASQELQGLYEPIFIHHAKNHAVAQVGFFVLKGLPFDI